MNLRGAVTLLLMVVIALALPREGDAQQLTQLPRTVTNRPRVFTPATVFNLTVQNPAPAGTCPAPTLAQCKNINYLVTACGQANAKPCQGLLKPEYEAYYNGLGVPVDRPVFPVGKPTVFTNLKMAKFHGSPFVKPVSKKAATADGAQLSFNQARLLGVIDPKTYVVNPAWETNASMESCNEYIYERYYDWARFRDGVKLCKGDFNCIMDVAYLPATPGIVNRQLKSKYGVPLEQPVLELPTAKNTFFALGSRVVGVARAAETANAFGVSYKAPLTFDELKAKFPQHVADLEELKKVLDDGEVFYEKVKTAQGNESYPNVWDFHSKKRQQTANVTENEWEEFERRRMEFEGYLDSSLASATRDMPVAVNQFMSPGTDVTMMFGADPFVRTNVWRNGALRGTRETTFNQIGVSKTSGAALQFSISESALGGVLPAVAVNSVTQQPGLPNPGLGILVNLTPQIACPQPKVRTIDEGSRLGMSKLEVEAANQKAVAAYSTCKILNLTLSEWWRYKTGKAAGGCNDRGSCGCLDLTSFACDWSRKMFWEAFAKALPAKTAAEREKHYDFCKRWAYMPFSSIPVASKKTPEALQAYLEAEAARVQAIAKKIPQKRNPPNVVPWDGTFGEDFAEEEIEGDEDSWSAGYKYDLGWTLKANQYKVLNGQKRPCSLQGQARAGFWVKMTTPIDGILPADLANLWRHAVDADAWVRANEMNTTTNKPNGEVRYEAHLIIANQELFADPGPAETTKSYKGIGYKTYDANDARTFKTLPLNGAYNPDMVINTVPSPKLSLTVWAGPVPITGAVWVEFFYGAKATASAKFAQGCTDNPNLFEAKVVFTPTAGLDGAMSIGVGISGFASVGVKGNVNVITVGLPLRARAYLTPGAAGVIDLGFDMGADLTLASLSGRLALYVEFMGLEEEWELFRWNGIGPETIPLLTLVNEKIPLFALTALAPP